MVATSGQLRSLSDTVWDRTWRRLDGLTDDEYLWEPAPGCLSMRTRPDGTRFGERAAISLLRDLYRWQRPISTDALTERAIRGDRTLLVDIGSAGPDVASALLSTAASFGRWALVEAMVDRGLSPAVGGRTPAHDAAGAGELDLLRKLVEHGADLAARDPDFDATPLAWARFIDRPHVVAWLEELGAPE